jgi:hypothetical protein
MDKKLTKEQYLEILRSKKENGGKESTDYAMVLYKGKVRKKCPPGTMQMPGANTCVNKNQIPSLRKKKVTDIGGVDPAQARQLAKAKTAKQVARARGDNKDEDKRRQKDR